ncbi:hypothetical protein AXG93_2015s1150 [Marchantia polymorpha subsp. ruderalis]|uniref:Methyltransferase domain-containing protein n=1 Tax=Marchantia polymorpha subsp. ruderalis TaxID=1480154 RepID=A0A176W2V4_MARPO|nr:hypothetical protein AXG93_2015s1150 [Marchantia polymorpha subsp. ruderalis]
MVNKKGQKGQRSYSAYNASNYLIASPASASPSTIDNDAGAKQESELGEENGVGAEAAFAKDKHALYQRAVQSPKGDISYLQKFFLNYVGGRTPLHLREDFCGTALICTEWVRADSRRTAVGLDLDEEALRWGLQNNICKAGVDAYNRVHLFCGNVLDDISRASRILADESLVPELTRKLEEQSLHDENERVDLDGPSSNVEGPSDPGAFSAAQMLPGADMVCSFNYSCCCLQKRADLVKYFREALKTIHEDGVKECLLEAGFSSVHIWIKQMSDTHERDDDEATATDSKAKYEEVTSFLQEDAWNAYIVAVAPRKFRPK